MGLRNAIFLSLRSPCSFLLLIRLIWVRILAWQFKCAYLRTKSYVNYCYYLWEITNTYNFGLLTNGLKAIGENERKVLRKEVAKDFGAANILNVLVFIFIIILFQIKKEIRFSSFPVVNSPNTNLNQLFIYEFLISSSQFLWKEKKDVSKGCMQDHTKFVIIQNSDI